MGIERGVNLRRLLVSFRPVVPWIVVFLLPAVVLSACAGILGVYPFGSRSFLFDDLKAQYYDFYVWFQNALLGRASLFYSTAQGLGSNMWPLYSYYLASPLNLLIVFFPSDRIVLFIGVVIALKVCFSCLVSTYYLFRRFQLPLVLCAAIALCYALSPFVITNLRNPLWLDSLACLPLVMWGVFKLVREGRPLPFTLALAYSVFVNWYLGYMTVLFSVLFTFVEIGAFRSDGSSLNVADAVRVFLKLTGSMAIALLLVSFTFVPTVLGMKHIWDDSMMVIIPAGGALLCLIGMLFAFKDLSNIHDKFLRRLGICIVSALFVAIAAVLIYKHIGGHSLSATMTTLSSFAVGLVSTDWRQDVTPQLYPGPFVLLLVAPYFTARGAGRFEKAVTGVVLGLLLMSALLSMPDTAWCGFQVPSGFYCRTAWLDLALFMWISARALQLAERVQLHLSDVTIPLICATLLLSGSAIAFGTSDAAIAVVTSVVSAVCVFAIYLSFEGDGLGERTIEILSPGAFRTRPIAVPRLSSDAVGKTVRRWCSLTLLGISVVVACSAIFTIGPRILPGSDQQSFDDAVLQRKAIATELSTFDRGWYRCEVPPLRDRAFALNTGLDSGQMQLSVYSSTASPAYVHFMQALGYSYEPTGNYRVVDYESPIVSSDALLGVKYVLQGSAPQLFSSRPVVSEGDSAYYENPFAIPLGYGVSAKTIDTDLADAPNPFEAQNELASALAGQSVELFTPVDAGQVESDRDHKEWTLSSDDGRQAYVWIRDSCTDGSNAPATNLSVDGSAIACENWFTGHSAYAVGPADGGSYTIDLDIEWANGIAYPDVENPQDRFELVSYELDPDVLAALVKKLGEAPFQVDDFTDDHISGSFDSDGQSLLMLSVPYDRGWTITVNGSEVSAIPLFGGALTGVPIQAEQNSIEMNYVPPGLVQGVIVSLITAGALSLYCLRNRTRSAAKESNTIDD